MGTFRLFIASSLKEAADKPCILEEYLPLQKPLVFTCFFCVLKLFQIEQPSKSKWNVHCDILSTQHRTYYFILKYPSWLLGMYHITGLNSGFIIVYLYLMCLLRIDAILLIKFPEILNYIYLHFHKIVCIVILQ